MFGVDLGEAISLLDDVGKLTHVIRQNCPSFPLQGYATIFYNLLKGQSLTEDIIAKQQTADRIRKGYT